jgi:hypothetical protein
LVTTRGRLLGLFILASFTTSSAKDASAAQARFFRLEGAPAFSAGDLDGLAVDSEGRLRMAPAARVLADAEAPYVWSMAADATGQVFLGTGNDGKIMKIDAGKAVTFFDTAELQVTALAFGPDGRLYAGTSPDGRVYAIDSTGNGITFVDPEDKYIWALGFDPRGRLWVGTGGEGRVLRVGPGAKIDTIFSDQETHIVSLAFDSEGGVLAGSSPGGVVYRISPAGRPTVLLNAGYREIKSIVPAPDGSVLVAAFGSKDRDEPERPAPPPTIPQPTPPAATGAEVTVSEAFVVAQAASGAPSAPGGAEPGRGTPARGAVLKVSSSGEADVLWTSQEEAPYSLLLDGTDVLVGTGPRGRLYRVGMDQSFVVLSDFPGEQITALQRTAVGDVVAATSNPGRAHALSKGSRETGSFTSKVLDAGTASSWGQVRFEADTPSASRVDVRTRSGQTPAPDNTWSDWSAPLSTAQGSSNDRPDGRYLQVKVTLTGSPAGSPVLHTVVAAYLQHNLRPAVTALTVHPPGEVFQKPLSVTGDMEILGLASQDAPENKTTARPRGPAASPTAFSRRLYQKGFQTLSWRGDDDNDDSLSYDVTYRPIAAKTWSVLREGLTDPVLAFDTQTLPNGRYVVRVTASDARSNPPAAALTATFESEGFDIDNTPPTILPRALPGSQPAIVAEVRDDQSVIRKVEFSVDGGPWFEVQPKDGIDDGLVESYDILLPFGISTGNHVVVIRALDALDNAATASVVVTR